MVIWMRWRESFKAFLPFLPLLVVARAVGLLVDFGRDSGVEVDALADVGSEAGLITFLKVILGKRLEAGAGRGAAEEGEGRGAGSGSEVEAPAEE
jgi:hypothetical protein